MGIELEQAVFVGMVVKTPPPPHIAFDLYVNVAREYQPKQNPEFCAWFCSLVANEVTEAEEGTVAYRLTRISPVCTAEKVTFLAGVWLSDEEIKKQATKKTQ